MLAGSSPTVLGVPWTDALTAIGTVAAFVVALGLGLWVNGLSEWLYKPRLIISIESAFPDCCPVELTDVRTGAHVSDQYYCRFRVRNRKWFCVSARDVEVLLYQLWDVSNTPAVEVQPFLPLNLKWSNVIASPLNPDRAIITPIIQPEVYRYVDLCFVDRHTSQQLEFSSNQRPNRMSGQMPTIKPPGKYELDTVVTGANYAPRFVTFRIDFTTKGWPPNTNFKSMLEVAVVAQQRTQPKHPVPTTP